MADPNNRRGDPLPAAVPPSPRPKLVVVVGPTAIGKTRLGIELALRFDGEVVNADSRYLYRGFDIGVAKPTAEERHGVPHHLIDILPPAGEMSLAIYQDLAFAAIADILRRGKLPLLVGGTPLYVNAVVENWTIPRVPPDPRLRAELEDAVAAGKLAALVERLDAVDPVAAARSARNPRRVIRALEVYAGTGLPMTAQEGKGPPRYDALELGLTLRRDALFQAIDRRVDDQLRRGLVAEVQALLAGGVPEDAPAMSSLGYRQLLPYLRGTATLEQARQRIVADTHRYVRHQETWLRRNPRLIRLDVAEPGWIEQAATLVERFLGSEPAMRSAVPGRG